MEVRKIDDDEPLDLELWLAYVEGDTTAFTLMYRRHASAVLRYAWSILGEQSAAEEALQETFLTAWEKRKVSNIVDESLLPWLLVVCRNHSRNLQRRARKHHAVSLDGAPHESALAQAVPVGEFAWIEAEIGRLSRADRLLCQLCLIEGHSYAQAARALETTPAAVGKRLSACGPDSPMHSMRPSDDAAE
ncbi:MAG: sigma factor [Galbitalea sp.]